MTQTRLTCRPRSSSAPCAVPADRSGRGIEATPGLVPCLQEDPDLWFAESPVLLDRAKAYCRECPLRAACLAGALARGEPWGVWGGEIFRNGEVVAVKRARGRPAKHAAA